jgi:hypothetical protein
MTVALVAENSLACTKVSFGMITQGKHKTNHLELGLECGLGESVFVRLVDTFVDESLDLRYPEPWRS